MTSNPLPGEPEDEASRRHDAGDGHASGEETGREPGRGADAIRLLEAFERAVNAGDASQVVALATPDVEVGGPRGRGHGTELLREWVARAGIHLRTRRSFQREGVIVAEQAARWGGEGGEGGEEHTVATELTVRGGRIAAVIRHDDLDAALGAAGLGPADEVPPR